MSGFNNRTNQARVNAMREKLGHIAKSARSNKAEPAEIRALLGSLVADMVELGVCEVWPKEIAMPNEEQAMTVPAWTDERRAMAIAHSKTDRAVKAVTVVLEELRAMNVATKRHLDALSNA